MSRQVVGREDKYGDQPVVDTFVLRTFTRIDLNRTPFVGTSPRRGLIEACPLFAAGSGIPSIVSTTARSLNLVVFWLKPILKSALLPPTGMLLVALIGLLVMGRFRRTGRALAIVGVIALALLAMPAVSGFLIHRLDR